MDEKKYSLIKNSQYDFMQVQPTPSSKEIDDFYKEEFYSGEYKYFNDSSLEVQLEDLEHHENNWRDILTNTEAFMLATEKKKVLDIGCGWGQFLLYLQRQGFECYGFDPAPEAIEYGVRKGLNVKLAGMERVDVFGKKQFDIVTLFNVLEHLPDPVKTIKDIRKSVIRQGGIIIIDVPNEFNSLQLAANETFNLNNWWVAPPAHLNYFDKDSLSALLEDNNFKVRIAEASFPMEFFLLFGENYVADSALGRACHKKRLSFEKILRRTNKENLLKNLYRSFAELKIGRQIIIYAEAV